jgi:predicted ferric reductase
VNVAAASIFQWHPISICSYDRETQEVTFVIKNVGDWTAKICDVVNSASMDSLVGDDVFRVRLCGPYGRIRYNVGADKEKNLYQYSNLVLVAGGIGCTPMISTLQWLIDNANDRGNEHGIHVTFLISARDHEMFSLFAEYFKKLTTARCFRKAE